MKTKYIGIGDIHEDTEKLADIPDIREADGILISGDMTNFGRPATVGRIIDRVRAFNPNVLAQIGNMDHKNCTEWLEQAGINLHRSVRELTPEVAVMGVGYSTPTPFNTPSEASEETIAAWLEETHAKIRNYKAFVLVVHTPPAESSLDRIGSGAHVGSPGVRRFIETHAPAACLTGHIHESRAFETIGRTPAVNPGMLSAGGYALLEIDGADVSIALQQV